MTRGLCSRLAVLLVCAVCVAAGAATASAQALEPNDAAAPFRIAAEPVSGGAQLLTVFGRPEVAGPLSAAPPDVPLVTVLRDTLGDDDPENDRLRHVWVHGYTSPSASQRIASAVPFLNQRAGNKDPSAITSIPPSVIDLGAPARQLWKSVLWTAAQYAFFDPYGVLAKTSVRAFRRNDDDYRKAHIIRALSVLALYDTDSTEERVLTPVEMRDVQARLVLAQKTLGGLIDDIYLQEVHEREIASTRDVRGHNWELLRQRVEAEGLYFDPLTMPDGDTTHVLVWVAKEDLGSGRRFDRRFLNIKSPWRDKRLRQWTGFTETRHFDADGRPAMSSAPGARAVELIPLALYGLDHPKIPAVLIDFRDHGNPKRREVSRRVLHDITRNILSLSPYGDLQYFVGRSVYNFVTGRRGMDINQPSRLRSYSQLKLLLALNATLDPALATETGRLLERVSMNPLQNDLDVEISVARQSYAALVAETGPGGALQALLQRDREKEFARLEHGRTARVFLRTATIASLGLYRHREDDPAAEQRDRVDLSRRLAFHRRLLDESLEASPVVDVTADIDELRRSLQFLVDHGSPADVTTARLAGRLFARTNDGATKRAALDGLGRLESSPARQALLAISKDTAMPSEWRARAAEHLGLPVEAATVVERSTVAGGD